MPDPFLEARGLAKRFPGVRALDGVDLTVGRGETVAVIGENGAGKSTLMKILAGVQTPDAGEIRVEGRAVRIDSVRAAEMLGIALIHQELNLCDNLDIACMVGLFAYNAPMCLEAIKGAGKVGKIKIVSFDEQDATLQGIKDGAVHGTVSQQPYQYGRHSVRILAALARKDESVLPPKGFLEVQSTIVKKDNVDGFWEELKKLRQ